MLIDTHCHLTYDPLSSQHDVVVRRALDVGVGQMITVATTPNDAAKAATLMRSTKQICMSAGIHPHEAGKVGDAELNALADWHHGRANIDASLNRRIVAVGETGLDFHYDFATPERQEEVFRFQLRLAIEVNRPVVIHAGIPESRVADILADYPDLRGRVVYHCFSADTKLAARILEWGCYISFTGVVTFKNADVIRESAKLAPRDRIMVETDCPYLSPVPVRKIQPNEPAFVVHTAKFLAELRGEEFDAFAAATTANAIRFFNLPEVS